MYKELFINDIEDLAEIMVRDIEDDKEIVHAVAQWDEATALVKEVLMYDATTIDYAELYECETCGEFLVSIDSDYCVYVEPFKNGDRYLYVDGNVYIFGDCNSTGVIDCNPDEVTVVMYSDESCEYDCDNCELCEGIDNETADLLEYLIEKVDAFQAEMDAVNDFFDRFLGF